MLPLVTLPAESLRQQSADIDRSVLASAEMQQFIDEMIPTMYGDDGIGLAAPQVGRNIRIFTIGKEAIKDFTVIQGTIDAAHDLVVVNPIWYKLSRKTTIDTEGCLSVPKTFGKVKRSRDIHVEALDRHGNTLSFDAHNYFARVVQHEVDHLNGILFIDRAKGVYTVD
ncbi:MAG: peptide deformylase [Candidatus Magasanikbacteria bacterium CG10_big_fil_rev_8_21_14_0_10_47_10]|uniref:Peptide deformylase n=1 Tax=Candidatus Magasanikbacteria bacterium CG10_big_fil_rev_8_21_14_0_10_47_10 TaxID=1974652 RepID=A0A2H0TPB6_9BACT|nr:MAG: peptide deformylase [Candidatus Magasanikbacteria bacterium CG10_big_fil_rev_8_21_14_0_10_47_10]